MRSNPPAYNRIAPAREKRSRDNSETPRSSRSARATSPTHQKSSSKFSASSNRRFATSSHDFLAQRPIRLLQVAPHLHQRLFLAAEIAQSATRLASDIAAELGFLSFQRHVLFPKKFHMHLRVAVKHLVAFRRKRFPRRMFADKLPPARTAAASATAQYFPQTEISLLRLRIVRVASHRDVALR